MTLPCISIVTPSYNQAQFLEETVRSVLDQKYPNLEYIVIDGGSTDGSVEIIRKYEKHLAYWISEADRGQSHAINKGFKKATGDLITFQNSDDIYLPGTFWDIAGRWCHMQEYGAIVGAFYYIDTHQIRETPVMPKLPNDGPVDLVLADPAIWRLHQVSTFYTREALDAVGRYVREDLNYTMDRELLYRVSKNYKILLADKPYGAFRWHGAGKSLSNYLAADLEYADLHNSYVYSDAKSTRRKRKVADYRRAKGYVRYAKSSSNRWISIKYLLSAVYCRPHLLFDGGFYLTWLKVSNIIHFVQRWRK